MTIVAVLMTFAIGCWASTPDVDGHWKKIGADTYLSIVERGAGLVAEIRTSDLRGGYRATSYPLEEEGEDVFITLPLTGRFPISHGEDAQTLDIAGERFQRIPASEAEAAFERFATANETRAANETLCTTLQEELDTRTGTRSEGDDDAWDTYLDQLAARTPQGCRLRGDERTINPF